jgi:hypothetical protein
MLTFVSGWRGIERDKVLLSQRDPTRRAVFFIEDRSEFPFLLPDGETIELYRHGSADVPLSASCETLVRLNHDTEHQHLIRAVSHTLINHPDAQIVVTYDSQEKLAQLYPAMRHSNALVATSERFDAPIGDHVIFSRGGSFRWRDNEIESQTALLMDDEFVDGGIIPDPEDTDNAYDYNSFIDYEYRP